MAGVTIAGMSMLPGPGPPRAAAPPAAHVAVSEALVHSPGPAGW